MPGLCLVCGQECHPREKNSVGVEVQEFSQSDGWRAVSEPFETYCAANTAMQTFPQDGTPRRVYSALQERS